MNKIALLLIVLLFGESCQKKIDIASLTASPPCVKAVGDGQFIWSANLPAFTIDTAWIIIKGERVDSLSFTGALSFQGDTCVKVGTVSKPKAMHLYIDTIDRVKPGVALYPFHYDGGHLALFGPTIIYQVTGTHDACTWPNPFLYKLDRQVGDTVFHIQLSRWAVIQ